MLTTHFPSNKLMKKIAYAIVDEKGKIVECFLDNGLYVYKTKISALENCEGDDRVIKVKIELYQK